MGNPITPPAPSATPATAVMHNLLAEFQPSSLPAPAAPAPAPAAPAGSSDIPGLPSATQPAAAPALAVPATAAPVGAEPEFDLAALGISTEDPSKDTGGELTEAIDPATTRGKQIWADHKLVRALELSPEQGGLGYRPTLSQITDMAKDSRALNNLVMDLQAKDKTANIAAMNHLLQLAPTAFLDLAQNLPPAMKEAARQRIVGEEVQALLEVARKFPETDEANKKYRQYWFQVANGLQYALTGKSLDPQVLYQAPKPAETATESLQRREQEVAQREQAIEQRRFDSWKADTVTRREKSIRQMVELVVKPVKASPAVKALAVDAIVARTLDQLRGQTGLMDQVTMLLRKAETQLANDDAMAGLADQIVDLYIRGASPIIRRQVAESVKNSTDMAAVSAEADAAKAKQASSGDPTPAGSPTAPGGAPQTGQSNGGVRAREKGETDQKYIQSVLGQVLRS